jgi:hypothetical protein
VRKKKERRKGGTDRWGRGIRERGKRARAGLSAREMEVGRARGIGPQGKEAG